ncbi:MAG: hypothetical protein IPJ55_16910 [Chloracidobacterium sp.]|nr:hypothetical protein [Chloracidobacterium sp.]
MSGGISGFLSGIVAGVAGIGTTYEGAEKLFGGDEKEGGIVGTLDIEMGEATQDQNDYLVSKISASVPAFRGILSAVWRGGQVSANNPYVKPWAFRVKRILQGWSGGTAWYPETAAITNSYCATTGVIEPELVLDALDADGVGVNGGTYSLSPLETLTIEYTQGLTYDAFSYFPADGDPAAAGLPWSCQVSVIADGVTTHYRTTRYATAVAASAAAIASGPITITWHSAYTVFIWDTFATNNRGGLSLKISATSYHIDMNPAHIVYQCLTDTSWGMGYPTSAIDDDSFTAAADTLLAESFGLSMLWSKQETIDGFIQIVLDHIGGLLYVRPDTGTFALKLIRSDYDRGTLTLYGPDTLVSAENYQRQAWGETVNEVTVIYTHPCTGKDTPITVQDMANVQIQGGVVSQTRNYPGIQRIDIAQRVALRDLQSVSTPLARIKLTATRAAWQVFPGDVFRLTWPEYGIDDVVYRALSVNRGTLQDGQIIIDAVEDVFGLPDNTYLVEQPSEWEDPSNAAAVAPYRKLVEAPYWDLSRTLSAADLDYVDALSGYLETLAVRPSGDATNYSIYAKIGAADYAEEGNGDFCASATIVETLTKTTTAITLTNGVDLDLVVAGGYAIIGDEYVLVSAIDAGALTATISRGVLDTVPADHTASTRIWFADGDVGFSTTEYADTEVLDVKLLPITGQGMLEITEAPSDSITFDQRQYRPYAPGKLLVNTSAYPEWIDGLAALSLTWAHRDRLLQTAYIVEQSEASIGPEAGVTYTLRIYSEFDILLRTESLSGTGYTYAAVTEAADLGVTGDTLWGSVVLSMSMNEVGLTDAKGKTVTLVGDVARSATQSKFGGYSAVFDGTGDYLSLASSIDFAFGTGDFTAECWIYLTTTSGTDTIFDFRPGANGAYLIFSQTNGAVSYGVNNLTPISAVGTLSATTWTHVAIARSGTTLKMFLAGIEVGSATDTTNYATAPLLIGKNVFTTVLDFGGYIDDVRITKGHARYTASFSPPTTEFPQALSAERGSSGKLRFELESVRGGLVSYQKHNHTVLREGYGFNYGYYYGGQ